ncbi:GLPGLI family protein [uncultured Tenacibaculum sp.]|uniref:GLPGLI family protein n=1 Tax=uncultured Tenacibaculum sp. TaxID=174713 RepID=UPI002625746E|nr:GLPGLI family protein [uncultured Tenacibaculum sp.]
MKSVLFKLLAIILVLGFTKPESKDFQGKAIYFSKATLELGRWGAKMSEMQKKQIKARLKNRLEKEYVLTFNRKESFFKEEEKIDAISGATDSWGKNFSPGDQYKNIQSNELIQSQEFYGKRFLVKDQLQKIQWKIGSESKKIGNYLCMKATASIPTKELTWYNFSWSDLRKAQPKIDSLGNTEAPEIQMTEVEAWYTPQIPVSHGPGEFWGLPGLILEVSTGDKVMLCSKVIMNPKDKIEIEAPGKGKEITKVAYQETIRGKMMEMRNNRGRRRR